MDATCELAPDLPYSILNNCLFGRMAQDRCFCDNSSMRASKILFLVVFLITGCGRPPEEKCIPQVKQVIAVDHFCNMEVYYLPGFALVPSGTFHAETGSEPKATDTGCDVLTTGTYQSNAPVNGQLCLLELYDGLPPYPGR
jgi:hypothetical protein